MKKALPICVALAMMLLFSDCKKDNVKPEVNEKRSLNNNVNTDAVTISQIEPASGIPFSAITIQGTGFSNDAAANTVKINGVTAIIHSATNTKMVVTVPGAASTGKVTVTANGNAGSSANDFEVLQPVKVLSINQPDQNILPVTNLIFNGGNIYGIKGYFENYGKQSLFKYQNNQITDIYTMPAPYINLTYPYNSKIYKLSRPVIGADGNIYVAQNLFNPYSKPLGSSGGYKTNYIRAEILKITPAGQVTVFAGGLSGNTDGNGTQAAFGHIIDLAKDAAGNLYVADDAYNIIKKIKPNADVITMGGGFNGLASIAVDGFNNIYAGHTVYGTGTSNSYVTKITPQGAITTLFKSTLPDYSNNYRQLSLDAANNLYIVSIYKENLRIVNTAGHIGGFQMGGAQLGVVFDGGGKAYNITQHSIDVYEFK